MTPFIEQVPLSVLGKGFASAAFSGVVMFSSEIYPTSLRGAALGMCSTMARIGGFLAPFVAASVSLDTITFKVTL